MTDKFGDPGVLIYHSHRAEPYFSYVKNGQKTIEGRIKKGKYSLIKPGDHIVVHNREETDSVEVLVKEVHVYNSFREMLEKEPLQKVLPNVKSIEEGLAVYQRFYTDKQQKEFGVIAIIIERVK